MHTLLELFGGSFLFIWCGNSVPLENTLNFIRKVKYLTDQFQLWFCFCIGNAK